MKKKINNLINIIDPNKDQCWRCHKWIDISKASKLFIRFKPFQCDKCTEFYQNNWNEYMKDLKKYCENRKQSK